MTATFTVDLDVLAANLRRVREQIAPAEHMLVVKDDAYRHGLAPIVRRAYAEGVRWFGALDVATGQAVRQSVPADARIFAWMLAGADDARDALDADLDIGVGSSELLELLAQEASARGISARVHVKIDTGLHRNGVRPEHWDAFTTRAAELERAGDVRVDGIWSHIAEASDAEDDAARAAFDTAVAQARDNGLRPVHLHLAASAAGFARPEFRYDLVRIGAFAYGIHPAGGPSADALGIAPIGELSTEVIRVGRELVTLDAGSTSGLPSTVAGTFAVRAANSLAPVSEIGPETMRAKVWEHARIGDRVTVFGRFPAPSATDIAEGIDTIGEEIVLRLGADVDVEYRGAGDE